SRVNLLIGSGHFFSHFYRLCLPPLFLVWQRQFGVGFAELGLSVVAMSVMAAALQTPCGFIVVRYGARRVLVGGIILMSAAVALMSVVTGFWQILLLSLVSGAGNAVFHPADYSILAGSIRKDRMGRSFAFHTFTGNVGFAAAPPVVAGLLGVMGWREALLILGLAGVAVAAAVLWQGGILDAERIGDGNRSRLSVRDLVFGRTMVLFFVFYLLGSMAKNGISAWLITILHRMDGIDLTWSSWALTAFLAGISGGALIGGWLSDRFKQQLTLFVVVGTAGSAAAILVVGLFPLGSGLALTLMFVAGLAFGGSRTPRDIMLKDAAPPGEVAKVFAYVSAALPLGGAITPVPFGFLIDRGNASLVLVISAGLLLA
ncbi:MAG: MFS transporter, partial [Xanthobacteraceae bacterium]